VAALVPSHVSFMLRSCTWAGLEPDFDLFGRIGLEPDWALVLVRIGAGL